MKHVTIWVNLNVSNLFRYNQCSMKINCSLGNSKFLSGCELRPNLSFWLRLSKRLACAGSEDQTVLCVHSRLWWDFCWVSGSSGDLVLIKPARSLLTSGLRSELGRHMLVLKIGSQCFILCSHGDSTATKLSLSWRVLAPRRALYLLKGPGCCSNVLF